MKRVSLIALALLLIACGGGTPETVAETPGEQTSTAPDTAAARFDPKAEQVSAPRSTIGLIQQDVQVTLADDAISMTPTLPQGQVMFNVTNSGTEEHSLAITGQGIEAKLATPLRPGQSDKLQVDLRNGSYVVHCPVGDHAARGHRVQLQVR